MRNRSGWAVWRQSLRSTADLGGGSWMHAEGYQTFGKCMGNGKNTDLNHYLYLLPE